MHIHKYKAKIKKKSTGGCSTLPKVPKLGVPGVKDTAKSNKDLSMSCYIQVSFSAGSHVIIESNYVLNAALHVISCHQFQYDQTL